MTRVFHSSHTFIMSHRALGRRAALALVATLLVAACSGGGGDTTADPPPAAPSSPAAPPSIPPQDQPPPPATPPVVDEPPPAQPPPSTPPPSTPPPSGPTGFVPIDDAQWTETSVRKVLHVFAFGGMASDDQIRTWADMSPAAAIEQMLTFSFVNERLSPAQDATPAHAASLQQLQGFWSGSAADNPMRWDKRRGYATLVSDANGVTYFISPENLQRTWVQAMRTRGINPVLHRAAFFLTNYQLSVKASLAGNGLMRSYYDEVLQNLSSGRPMTAIIASAAKSAAVAARYEHRNNMFFNDRRLFAGNDDFAREYFQLFFRLTGVTEDTHYHETVSIQNNARLLTGMQVTRVPNAYGSSHHGDWVMAPLHFTDHVDAEGRVVLNATRHHIDCLEILHRSVCGRSADEKLGALSPYAAAHPETLANLPVFIIEHFADDHLSDEKMATIRGAWRNANDDLLTFLRSYAISTTFHREDTVKFASTFTRNLALSARTVLNNTEAFVGMDGDFPRALMHDQGGDVFEPVHDVFGSQTGMEASINAGVFKSALDSAVQTQAGLALVATEYYTDATRTTRARWLKDWRLAHPPQAGGAYVVRDLAEWLWQRVQSDGGKNFDVVARSQVYAFLASGVDFGSAVTTIAPAVSTDPDTVYSSAQLLGDERLRAVLDDLASRHVQLDSDQAVQRQEANRRTSLAADFIAATPYSFALEGR